MGMFKIFLIYLPIRMHANENSTSRNRNRDSTFRNIISGRVCMRHWAETDRAINFNPIFLNPQINPEYIC